MSTAGNGRCIKWIEAHVSYPHDFCLIWPFGKTRGYGIFGHLGKRYYAHRYMCELVNGPPPTDRHEAAHSCGRGHEGCTNPKHLSWKTASENLLDCRDHGTQARSRHGIFGKLDHDKAQAIRDLKGIKTQREIATEFGISESTVSDIWLGRTWARPHKIQRWTADEELAMRQAIDDGKPLAEIAKIVGKSYDSVAAHLYRSGLFVKSGHHSCRNS